MVKTVFIQKQDGQFAMDYTFCAYDGFQFRGLLNYVFFEHIDEVPVRRNNMVVGFVEDTRVFFKRLKIQEPTPMGIPKTLEPMVKRKHKVVTLKEFYEVDMCPIFAKPYSLLKGCSSGVINRDSSKRFVMSDAPQNDDFLLFTSDVVDIKDEFRCFIHNGKVVDVRHYNIGNGMNFPDPKYINDCVDLMNGALDTPCAYSLDVMVLADGTTELVECNDCWSLGSYGLDGEIYAKMLLDRWNEILRQNPII